MKKNLQLGQELAITVVEWISANCCASIAGKSASIETGVYFLLLAQQVRAIEIYLSTPGTLPEERGVSKSKFQKQVTFVFKDDRPFLDFLKNYESPGDLSFNWPGGALCISLNSQG